MRIGSGGSRQTTWWVWVLSLLLHGSLVLLVVRGVFAEGRRTWRVARATGTPQPAERLVYVRGAAGGVVPGASPSMRVRGRGTPITVVNPPAPSEPATSLSDSMARSGTAVTGRDPIGAQTGTSTMTDSIAGPDTDFAGQYVRPIPKALIGLVPRLKKAAVWGGQLAVPSLVPALAPRPAPCREGQAGLFTCVRRELEWREDSILHVTVRCRDAEYRRRPPDCARWLVDTARAVR